MQNSQSPPGRAGGFLEIIYSIALMALRFSTLEQDSYL